ncbi:hypothetical protein XF36_02045 [Pseudonocardia sp. HH130629-09]|nr:hypothetical protein XF36_02045 [Pseudonocardia sp. HH130629-09]
MRSSRRSGFAPGSVVGSATTAAFGLLSGASGTDFWLPTGPFTVMPLSFVVGSVALGYGCSLIVGRLTARATAPAAARPAAAPGATGDHR